MRHPAVRIFCQCSSGCLLGSYAMSSGTIEGPQLRANKASIRGPERRPIEHFPYGRRAPSPTSAQLALRPPDSEASRPPITSPRDQLDLITGVSPMRSSIRLERSTIQSSRSTWSQHRGLSDAVIHPIETIDDAVVEVDSVSSSESPRCRRRPKQRDVKPSQVASTVPSWSLRSDH